ncbi:MAG: hypothetical protein ACQEU4_20675 [Bacillota bacterium]
MVLLSAIGGSFLIQSSSCPLYGREMDQLDGGTNYANGEQSHR